MTMRRTKNYTTKINVLERPTRECDLHLEGSAPMLKSRKRTMVHSKADGLIDKKIHDLEFAEAFSTLKEVERRSSHTDLSKLLKSCRHPQPVLTQRDIRNIQKNDSNHDEIISTHIKKMKEGIQRLQEITQKFNCTETYKEDIDFLTKNVKNAISRSENRTKRKF